MDVQNLKKKIYVLGPSSSGKTFSVKSLLLELLIGTGDISEDDIMYLLDGGLHREFSFEYNQCIKTFGLDTFKNVYSKQKYKKKINEYIVNQINKLSGEKIVVMPETLVSYFVKKIKNPGVSYSNIQKINRKTIHPALLDETFYKFLKHYGNPENNQFIFFSVLCPEKISEMMGSTRQWGEGKQYSKWSGMKSLQKRIGPNNWEIGIKLALGAAKFAIIQGNRCFISFNMGSFEIDDKNYIHENTTDAPEFSVNKDKKKVIKECSEEISECSKKRIFQQSILEVRNELKKKKKSKINSGRRSNHLEFYYDNLIVPEDITETSSSVDDVFFEISDSEICDISNFLTKKENYRFVLPSMEQQLKHRYGHIKLNFKEIEIYKKLNREIETFNSSIVKGDTDYELLLVYVDRIYSVFCVFNDMISSKFENIEKLSQNRNSNMEFEFEYESYFYTPNSVVSSIVKKIIDKIDIDKLKENQRIDFKKINDPVIVKLLALYKKYEDTATNNLSKELETLVDISQEELLFSLVLYFSINRIALFKQKEIEFLSKNKFSDKAISQIMKDIKKHRFLFLKVVSGLIEQISNKLPKNFIGKWLFGNIAENNQTKLSMNSLKCLADFFNSNSRQIFSKKSKKQIRSYSSRVSLKN